MFQSFLYWNWPLKKQSYEIVRQHIYRFNPFCTGIGLWSGCIIALIASDAVFQSFLYWNWPLKRRANTRNWSNFRPFQSFLYWNWPLKLRSCRAAVSMPILFQSFLYWNWPLKTIRPPTAAYLYLVSILFVLELAFEVNIQNTTIDSVNCFNPFCTGIGLWRHGLFCRNRTQGNVSILFVLELAFEAGKICSNFTVIVVSILFVLELAFEEDGPAMCVDIVYWFQSFLYWNWPLKGVRCSLYAAILSGFNPFCTGIGLWRPPLWLAPPPHWPVSILFVLELAFEDFLFKYMLFSSL